MQHKFYILRLSVILCLLLNTFTTQARTIRALFLGNSYTAVNDLPSVIANMAASTGDELIYEANTPGGYTLRGHTTNPGSLALIAEGGWDYVILQEQSQLPAFPDEQVEEECYPYAIMLDSLIKAANPCTKTVFYVTWGRKNGDASNCAIFPPICTYEGMDSLLTLRYSNMAEMNRAMMAPAGPVWHYIRDTYAGIELYSPDESHPTMAGTYAAAAAFYSVMFEKNPVDCSFVPGGLSTEVATDIRTSAKVIAFDSLDYWMRFYEAVTADFDYTADGTTLSFSDLSQHADSIRWFFGDGNTATETSPVHTYAADGIYEVMQVAYGCNENDTLRESVTIGISSLSNPSDINEISLHPNPATEQVSFQSRYEIESVQVTDLQGRSYKTQNTIQNLSAVISLDNLAPGQYILLISTSKGISTKRFVKQ